jgi:hypothetical protein
MGAASVPLLAATAYFAWNSVLPLAWMTTVRIPIEISEQVQLERSWHRWKDLVIGPILPLAIIALLTARRRGTFVRETTLVLTGLVTFGLAWPQFAGQYRMLMLAAPCGLLAVIGADPLWRWVEGRAKGLLWRRPLVFGAAAVLIIPMLWGPYRLMSQADEIPSWGLGEKARNARDFILLDEHHDQVAAPVRDKIPPGAAIYVFGHPQIYELVDAYPAIAISGWDVDDKPYRVWAELDRELTRAQPEWIYIEDEYRDEIKNRSPHVATMLATYYRRVATVAEGSWYQTASPGQPCGIPCDNQLDRWPTHDQVSS